MIQGTSFNTAKAALRRSCGAAAGIGFALAAALGSLSSVARADTTAAIAAPAQEMPGSVTHGHVFLTGAGGCLYDATQQIVTVSGQTYVCVSSTLQPIFINYQTGNVYDATGMLTGFVELI